MIYKLVTSLYISIDMATHGATATKTDMMLLILFLIMVRNSSWFRHQTKYVCR